jgi:hypothetical protein
VLFGFASSFGIDLGGGGEMSLPEQLELFKVTSYGGQTLLSPLCDGKNISLAEMYIKIRMEING